jgi:hypothetical protein
MTPPRITRPTPHRAPQTDLERRRTLAAPARVIVGAALRVAAAALRRVAAGTIFRVLAAAPSALGIAVLCTGCAPSAEPSAPAATPEDAATSAAELDTEGWQTYTDSARGISFRYPSDLGTSYIRPLDWPPMAQVLAGPLQCTEAGSETARAGRTEQATIGGRSYCITRETEGAAGSLYTSLAYALERDGRVVILTFSLRAVQCGNYDDPRKRECETEREAFDVDVVIDRIARTIER